MKKQLTIAEWGRRSHRETQVMIEGERLFLLKTDKNYRIEADRRKIMREKEKAA